MHAAKTGVAGALRAPKGSEIVPHNAASWEDMSYANCLYES